jgi:hypothetical protein
MDQPRPGGGGGGPGARGAHRLALRPRLGRLAALGRGRLAQQRRHGLAQRLLAQPRREERRARLVRVRG